MRHSCRSSGFAFAVLFVVHFLCPALTISASAANITSTYPGTVVRVTDGDTILIHIDVQNWPLFNTPMKVRLDGIDTPESMKQFAKCTKELRLGLIAKTELKNHLPPGTGVTVVWVGRDEKYGRMLSIVYVGTDSVNAWMVKRGYAAEYHGGTKSSWCS